MRVSTLNEATQLEDPKDDKTHGAASNQYLLLHLLSDEVVFGEIPSEGPEAARVVEGGAADEAGHARHAVDAEQARDQVDARQPRPEVDLVDKMNLQSSLRMLFYSV